MTRSESETVDVAVVGLGPTGLILAQLLGYEGVRVAAIDRSRLPIPYPRATHLDDETMRSFQTAGLAELEKTFSLVGNYNWYDPEWRLLMTISMNRGRTAQKSRRTTGWPSCISTLPSTWPRPPRRRSGRRSSRTEPGCPNASG